MISSEESVAKATSAKAADELRPGGTLFGAPARHLIPAVGGGAGMAVGVNTVAGIVLGVVAVAALILMHKDDPDALEIWAARLRPPWWRRWEVGVRRPSIHWLD
jgi:hypothetical protein